MKQAVTLLCQLEIPDHKHLADFSVEASYNISIYDVMQYIRGRIDRR